MRRGSDAEARPAFGPAIFIAAYMAAVMLLYGVALVAGGGFASPPFPPDLPYAPKRALAAGVTWHDGAWRVSGDAQAQSGMFVLNKARADGAPNTAQVGGFSVFNLRAAYALPVLGPRGEVFVALEDLADRRYASRPGYPMPCRSGQIGINLSL